MAINKRQEERLSAALDYADRGWRVLPVGRDKKPINPNGSRGATTDNRQIAKWWMETPFANIGVATGPESFWVVDIDLKSGANGLESLTKHFGKRFDFKLNDYLCQKTPTGGIHMLFQWPDGVDIRNAQGILPGVDLRGSGGYIVVAPSARDIAGKWIQYRWNNAGLPISPPPAWALELLELQLDKQEEGVDYGKAINGLTVGERDTYLYRFACSLAGKGYPKDVTDAFVVTAAERCSPPFSAAVAREKVANAYKSIKPRNKQNIQNEINDLEKQIEALKGGVK